MRLPNMVQRLFADVINDAIWFMNIHEQNDFWLCYEKLKKKKKEKAKKKTSPYFTDKPAYSLGKQGHNPRTEKW
jgi:hypothetical protein